MSSRDCSARDAPMAVVTFFSLKKHPPGDETMQKIAHRVYVGAMTFLKREYTIIAVFMVIVFIALATMLSMLTGLAYLAGALSSMFAGWFGMQAGSMQRIAELYYATGNATAKALLDKWVPWAMANTTIGTGGDFEIPSDLTWTGAPATRACASARSTRTCSRMTATCPVACASLVRRCGARRWTTCWSAWTSWT